MSREAIYAQTNKLQYSNSVGEKVLERKVTSKVVTKPEEKEKVTEGIIKRENMVLAILMTEGIKAYEKLKAVITVDEFKYEVNKQILKKLYDEFEKGNSNINNILDSAQDEQQLNQITKIMADDYNIQDIDKATLDIINIYEKEKTITRRNKILERLESQDLTKDERAGLESELSNIIIKLARFK